MTSTPRGRCARHRTTIAALISGALSMLAPTGVAQARTYTIVACSDAVNALFAPSTNGGPTPERAGMAAYAVCPASDYGGNVAIQGLVARVSMQAGTAQLHAGAAAFQQATVPSGLWDAGVRVSSLTADVTGGWRGNWHQLVQGWSPSRGWETLRDNGGSGSNYLSSWITNVSLGDLGAFAGIRFGLSCSPGPCTATSLDGAPAAYNNWRNVRLTVEDPTSPSLNVSGRPWSGEWTNTQREPAISYSTADAIGIAHVDLNIDGSQAQTHNYGCDVHRWVPCDNPPPAAFTVGELADGEYSATLTAYDYAGNPSSQTATVRVDRAAPEPPSAIDVAGGQGWKRDNAFTIRWTNTDNGGAPIVAAHYKLCPAGRDTGCRSDTVEGDSIDAIDDVQVPNTGTWQARVWLEDAAGNSNQEQRSDAVTLRFDNQPPTGSFESPNSDDPRQVTVAVHDDAAGIAGGQIELAGPGSEDWQTLPTSYADGQLSARANDLRMARGTYRLRALVSDNAGNRTVIAQDAAQREATLSAPLRARTRLTAGVKRVGQRDRVRRRGHVWRAAVLVSRVRARYRHRLTIRGRLTSAHGQPLAGTQVAVLARALAARAPMRRVATVTTTASGRFSYRTVARTSRQLRFVFAGANRIAPARRTVRLTVRASSTIHARPRTVVNGSFTRLFGRLRGGHIPREGVRVALKAWLPPLHEWRMVGTTVMRTDSRGRWQTTYPFIAQTGHKQYAFLVEVLPQADYPFARGYSHPIQITTIGL